MSKGSLALAPGKIPPVRVDLALAGAQTAKTSAAARMDARIKLSPSHIGCVESPVGMDTRRLAPVATARILWRFGRCFAVIAIQHRMHAANEGQAPLPLDDFHRISPNLAAI
jgi:hypothetical protein